MRHLLLLALLCCGLSVQAQNTLDSLPFDDLLGNCVVFDPEPTKVMVGYGQQELPAFNGAVTHLETRQFNQGQINDWNQLWQAQVPGFTIARAGSNPNEAMDARIRGLRTMSYGSTQPLYVVDGVPGVDLFAVDPSDIVAVDVLRGAASTAIYGGRGSGGVVLITTKPASVGPLKIQYEGQVSVESAAKRYTVLNETAFIGNGGVDYSPGAAVNTDWQDEILQTGVSHAHHLSVSKALGQGFVKAGLHYRDVTGILRESGFEQYNGSLLLGQRFWRDRLNVSAGATLGQRNANYGFPEAYKYAVTSNPSSPVRSDDPTYSSYGGYVEKDLFDYFNPVAIIEQNRNSGRTDFHLLHARAELGILPNLMASVQVSEQTRANHNLEFYSAESKFRGRGTNGLGTAANDKTLQKTLESTLTYRLDAGDWQGELLAGYGWYHNQVSGAGISATRLLDNTWVGKTWEQYRDVLQKLYDPNYISSNYTFQSDRQLSAFFGRARLQWQNTYFGTFSWRKEGSSNLAPATRWGVSPAFTLGVDVNKWLQIRPVDYLKISVGQGTNGTEMTQSALYQRLFNVGPLFYYNGQYVPSYGVTQNPNDQLGWERTTENSLDVRFSLWGGRLQGAVDWYRYRSRDLIQRVTKPIPPNFASSTIENVGEISGHGTELALNYQLVKNQDLTWEVGLSATTGVSTLENVGYGADTLAYGIPGTPCGCGVNLQVLYPGVTVGTFWGPVATGIDEQGAQTYQDIDRDGQTGFLETENYSQDQTRLGTAQPRWQLGLSQKLTWRNLDLNFLLQAVTGHQIFHYYRYAYEANSPVSRTWNHVITRYYDPALLQTRFNSRMIEDASFLRLQYVSLGYRLKLDKSKWLHSLHFQIGAQNLFTISQYTGLDPELRLADKGPTDNGGRVNSGYGDPLSPGNDRGGYPTARRWWLGVQAAF